MKWFDPARPQWGFGPAYCDRRGKPIAALKPPITQITEEGDCLLLWLMVGYNEASQFKVKLTDPHIFPQVMADLRENPEAALKQWFGYDPAHYNFDQRSAPVPKLESARGKATLTLDDII